jgi:hypothetical protein
MNFNTLGLTPGTYTYTWGTGPDQSLTVQIGSAAVPEPSTAILAAIGAVAFGTCGWFHHRRHQRRQVSTIIVGGGSEAWLLRNVERPIKFTREKLCFPEI